MEKSRVDDGTLRRAKLLSEAYVEFDRGLQKTEYYAFFGDGSRLTTNEKAKILHKFKELPILPSCLITLDEKGGIDHDKIMYYYDGDMYNWDDYVNVVYKDRMVPKRES